MSMSATRGRTRLLAGLLLVAVLVAVGVFWWARDSGDPQAQSDSPKTSGGPTVSELAQKYLSGQPATAEAVASAQGTIYARNDASPGDVKDVPATLRILAVEAGPDSTHVRISLSTDSPAVPLFTPYIKVSSADVRGFELTAESADLRLTAGLWSQAENDTLDCACAYLPASTAPSRWS